MPAGTHTRQTGSTLQALPKLVAALRETERFPSQDLQRRQALLIDMILDHHTATTPAFQQRLARAGRQPSNARGLNRLREIPPISRADIQRAGDTFQSTAIPPGHLPLDTVKTSGSTGEPVRIAKTAVNQLYWFAFGMRDHAWNQRDMSRRLCAIRAGITQVLELPDWGAPANLLGPTGPCLGIPITTPISRQSELLDEAQPDTLLVYPNNLRALADEWLARGRAIPSLRHIRTVGETVSDELRSHVLHATGLAIEDSYSSQEAGPIAIQCPEGGLYHIMSEALVVEVLDTEGRPCAIGETGRVVVTDLHNQASPLIRYDIGDYASVAGPCMCGRTLPTLSRIKGRERNLLRRPNGERHWPLVGFHNFDSVAPVRQYQFIQHTLSGIEMFLVTDEELTHDQQQAFIAIAAGALGHEFQFALTQSRTRRPIPPNGKFEEFVCRIS